jgi:hypothetical protein
MKTLSKFLFNFVSGLLLFFVAGLNPLAGAFGMTVFGCIPQPGALMASVYREVWTGEQIKAFRTSVEQMGWLNRITAYDSWVRPGIGTENDVIHLISLGVDPDVLINNTTYPIDKQSIIDTDVPFSLDKYQTKATVITDDELYAITYDKISSTIERHTLAVNNTKYLKAIHALAPAADTAKTPVIATTGDTVAGRRRMTRLDIIALKKRFDMLNVPLDGRILVLCPDHVEDMLSQYQVFSDQYYNYGSGKVVNLYGFEIYEYTGCPYFTPAGAKAAWNIVPTTELQASVAFYAPRMLRATGRTVTYPTPAEATMQEHLYNMRHYFICLPKVQEAIGAIYSAEGN